MKKVYGAVTALSLAAVFALGGCGNQKGAAPASEKEPESKDVVSAMEIDYANPDFEYEIPDTYKSTEFTTPQKNASDIISVSDSKGSYRSDSFRISGGRKYYRLLSERFCGGFQAEYCGKF